MCLQQKYYALNNTIHLYILTTRLSVKLGSIQFVQPTQTLITGWQYQLLNCPDCETEMLLELVLV